MFELGPQGVILTIASIFWSFASEETSCISESQASGLGSVLLAPPVEASAPFEGGTIAGTTTGILGSV